MGGKRSGRKREPRIEHLATYPATTVCIAVAAEYLGRDVRTVRARIDDGRLPAVRDGKVYRIPIAALAAYEASLSAGSPT